MSKISQSEIEGLLSLLNDTHKGVASRALVSALKRLDAFEVQDLWWLNDIPSTYALLLMSGINHDDEMALARELVHWQAFAAKDSAKVRCLQSSDRFEFKACMKRFRIRSTPTLLISTSPDMTSYVRVSSGLLAHIASNPGSFEKFMTRIHQCIEDGMSLTDVEGEVFGMELWRNLRLAMKEVKGFISFNVDLDNSR